MRRAVALVVLALGASCTSAGTTALDAGIADATVDDAGVTDAAVVDSQADAAAGLRVSVFSRTNGYRHDSIPAALAMIASQGSAHGWRVMETEDPAIFTANLATTDVVVFALTSGNDILDADQKTAFEGWVAEGHGFVGIHSATDTEYLWPFYHELVGATFKSHPPGLYDASVDLADASHPVTAGLPTPWTRTDEWYSFTDNPAEAGTLDILLTLDESTFAEDPSLSMTPHPISWAQTFEGTRAFYMAMGHPAESYSDPTFVAFLTRAIEWAGRVQ